MAREMNRLSARRVETLKEPGRHADGGGLYLAVSASGARKWVFFYKFEKRQREMGLGSARDVSLAQARVAAGEARALLAQSADPLEARRSAEKAAEAQAKARSPLTFGEVADEFLDAMGPSWRNEKHRQQWEVTLGRREAKRNAGTYAKPLRPKPVAEITTEDVLSVLKPIWQTKPETASRLRGRIEAAIDAARAGGHRTGENPARWRGHLDKLLPRAKKLSRGHHSAMPFVDVPGFVAELRANGSVSALALEFLILTGARSGEVRGMAWGEVSHNEALWTVPAERMKGHREHRVPLAPRALAILTQLRADAPEQGDYVFLGAKAGRPLSVMALTMAMRRLDVGEFTPHGFRSTFRDWAGECTTFPREIAEAALAHLVGDEVERAYRRGDALLKRRKLMLAWASYLDGRRGSNVLSLPMAS